MKLSLSLLMLACYSCVAQPLTQSELAWNIQWKKFHQQIVVDPTNGCGISLEAETVAYLQCVTTNASADTLPADWPRNWGVTNCTYYACGGSSNNLTINIPRALNETVIAMKAAGLWTKQDGLYLFPFCGYVFGQTNALIMNSINMINPSTTLFRMGWSAVTTSTNFTGDGFVATTNDFAAVDNGYYGAINDWTRQTNLDVGFGTYIIDSPFDAGYLDNVSYEVYCAANFIGESSATYGTGNGFFVQSDNIFGEALFDGGSGTWKGFHHVSAYYTPATTNLSWNFYNNGQITSTNGIASVISADFVSFSVPGYYDGATTAYGGKMGAAFFGQHLDEASQIQFHSVMHGCMKAFGRN